MSKGRGSNTGGTQLSTTSLPGNKYWKYKLWRFGRQFLKPDSVPEYLDNAHASIVTANHVSKNQSEKTCSACYLAFDTEHHGHKCTDAICPINEKETTVIKKERLERKADDARKLDALTTGDAPKGGRLADALEKDRVKRAKLNA